MKKIKLTLKKIKKKPLIYNRIIYKKDTFRLLIIIGVLYSIQLLIRRILTIIKINGLDLWISNIIFILIFMHYFFAINIYKHQKFSLIFIFSTNFMLLIFSTFLKTYKSIISENKNNKNLRLNAYQHIEEVFGNVYYFIFIYIIYLILSGILSFTRVFSKQLT